MGVTATKVIGIAARELGYKEKASNAQLDDKTANAGKGNFTKYARDLYGAGYYNGNKNGFAWCDVFVDWCVWQACGKDTDKAMAMEYQTGNLGAGCVYSAGYYKAAKRWFTSPKAGDQIFFWDADGDEGHTGLVEKVEGGYVDTIEGNRDNCVARYKYAVGSAEIAGYGRPNYEAESDPTPAPKGRTETGRGIDVSGCQGMINWETVKASGVDFAIIKMGCIYESSGTVDLESTWRRNVSECERLGIPYGVYVFTYVRSQARMKIVMKYVVEELKATCKKHTKKIPVYIDIEAEGIVQGGKANLLAMIKTFVSEVEKAGYPAGVYCSTNWWNYYLDDPWYDTKAKWVADWRGKCYFERSYGIWQHSQTGRVPGISTNVDMDIAYFDYASTKGLTEKEQTYVVSQGETWAYVAEVFGMKPLMGAYALLEYNNYKTDGVELPYKVITQKTIKIPPMWIPGDVNGDGKLTAADARRILRASAKLEDLTPAEKMRADFDGDGKITASDARAALRKAAKLE